MSTVFKKIIDKEIPADIVYEDDLSIAFRDINPVAPVHILIIPKKEIPMLSEMNQEDTNLVGHLLWVATKIAKNMDLKGFRVVINNGKEGGQHIFHLHVHLVSGRPLSWPPG
ncbi:MAG: histidine triad nucleotide-binding protein [Deltaproteobacteria bacterium]|nr:histidine triad nucleotide-binding protein [Deltaproteobacteria bacterium]MCX7952894.1 histidine triad nucleotide-binding protein [Deltaproteobacteria bacterium]